MKLMDGLNKILKKYSLIARRIYLILLGGSIVLYFIMYLASGHKFNPPKEDYIFLLILFISFISMAIYSDFKLKTGAIYKVLKYIVILTLSGTILLGIRILIFLIKFKYGDDISFLEKMITFLLSTIFIMVAMINFLSFSNLIKKNK